MEYTNIKKVYYENLINVKTLEENIHTIIYCALSFFIPFFLSHPQLLVGVIVNAALILGATYVKGHKIWPIILLPSIAVLLQGVIFGSYTIYLLYLIPIIWIGNAILVYGYKFNYFKKKNYLYSVLFGGIFKVAFIFLCAFIMVSLGILPQIFLIAMGPLQAGTLALGAIGAYGIIRIREASISKHHTSR